MNDEFITFLREFIYPHECAYDKGHDGDLNHVRVENVAGDPGGVTKWGIDKSTHPHLDIPNLTMEQADEVYWSEWIKNGCGDIKGNMAYAFFDTAVNAGVGRARKLAEGVETAKDFLDAREAWYRRLVASRPSFKKFLNGWINRVTDLRKYLNV